ncbi:MAG: D-3-phosphoglycerate dehydrogenase [Phycisphaerae bacterium]|nr:D-3-phosphoglycerate dehydrogenase [Phycisphaerae bacterium]
MPRILVSDKLAEEGLALLRQYPDIELTVKTGLDEDALAAEIGHYDGLIIRSGSKVTAKVLAKSGKLRAIARAGVGVDNVDLKAATDRGVLVMNTPDANTLSTAEHTIALLCALSRHVVAACQSLRAGQWERNKFTGVQLAGKTLGIIGLGRVGKAVAARALGLQMQVIGYDPFVTATELLDGQVKVVKSVDELLAAADYITLHTPKTAQTANILNAEALAKCRKGVRIINCARGGLVDEAALAEAIKAGHVAGAAFDVFPSEPPPADNPLLALPQVVVTPHLGASTTEAQLAVSVEACEAMIAYLARGQVSNAVNLGPIKLDLSTRGKQFADLAERMGGLVAPLAVGGVKRIEVTVQSEQLSGVAGTLARLLAVALLRPHRDTPVNVVNIAQILDQYGIAVSETTRSAGAGGESAQPDRLDAVITCGDGRKLTVAGTVLADGLPRIREINGYSMDMVPAASMVLLFNQDKPGVIGMVGNAFGKHNVNIADMTISGRAGRAIMVLRVDGEPAAALLKELADAKPVIEEVHLVALPPAPKPLG